MQITITAVREGEFGINIGIPNEIVKNYRLINKEKELNQATAEFANNLNNAFLGWYQLLTQIASEGS